MRTEDFGKFVLAAEKDDKLLVMVNNLAGEPRDDFALRFSPEWRGFPVSRIAPDGTLLPLGKTARDLSLPQELLQPLTPEFLVVDKTGGRSKND